MLAHKKVAPIVHFDETTKEYVSTNKDMKANPFSLHKFINGFVDSQSKFNGLEQDYATHEHIKSSYSDKKKNAATSKHALETSHDDLRRSSKRMKKVIKEFELAISSAKSIFMPGKNIWSKTSEYEEQVNKKTSKIVQIIETSYAHFLTIVEIYKVEQSLGVSTVLRSHEKVSYLYDQDPESTAAPTDIHLSGVFLEAGEMFHPAMVQEPEAIVARGFNLMKFNAEVNWVYLTDHEYESHHRTAILPCGMYCFTTDVKFSTLNLGHGPGEKIVKLEHCTIPRYTCDTIDKRDRIKELSECYLELQPDNGSGRKNEFYDARLTKTNVGATSRQYLAWLSDSGRLLEYRRSEKIRKDLKAHRIVNKSQVPTINHGWTYSENKHGLIVQGDFAMERTKHELRNKPKRTVVSARTEFHLNFSGNTIHWFSFVYFFKLCSVLNIVFFVCVFVLGTFIRTNSSYHTELG